MELNIPRPAPSKDGDYRTFVNIGYGNPYAVIHLAEGGSLDLTGVQVEDCDRLIRAAAKVKEELLGFQAEAAAPHGRDNLYHGTCQLCGKPEADELHAEPAPVPSGTGGVLFPAGAPEPEPASPEEVAALAASITAGTYVVVTDDAPASVAS